LFATIGIKTEEVSGIGNIEVEGGPEGAVGPVKSELTTKLLLVIIASDDEEVISFVRSNTIGTISFVVGRTSEVEVEIVPDGAAELVLEIINNSLVDVVNTDCGVIALLLELSLAIFVLFAFEFA
jgi:hypothetical protein